MARRTKTEITDFTFEFVGYGHYNVIYTSPNTNKQWCYTTNNMPLIDATKNCETPKRKDLNYLKYIVKTYGY